MAGVFHGTTARPRLPLVLACLPPTTRKLHVTCSAASKMDGASPSSPDAKKTTTVFVAGSTGKTGKRVVAKLLERGFGVVAGTTDVGRARGSLPQDPNLQLVRADVTDGPDKLVEAVRGVDAVICATGFRRSFDPFAPWKVDNLGTVNLVEACRKAGVTRFILVSSILVNGAAMGQLLNPAYIVLNLFGLVLVAKLQAEKYIRGSGINYTIVRPGGLTEQPPTGNIVLAPEIGKRGEKRKQPYPYSDSDSTDNDVPYNFVVDSDGDLPDVDDYNYKSFTMQVEEQLWREGCSAYLNRKGEYFCKFHTRGKGIPRDGLRCGLVQHAKAISQGAGAKDLRDQGEHDALYAVLTHYDD